MRALLPLTEAVDTAWDADAEKVDIRIDPDGKWIEIADDGMGMSVADMNDKYLRVGYRRREEVSGRVTPKGRPVMGRKGLGKLSLFSIADTIEVHSAKDGGAHGLRMTVSGIHDSVRDQKPFYSPARLAAGEVTVLTATQLIIRSPGAVSRPGP